MQILYKIAQFSAPITDLVTIYISYVRSILEQSCTIWHSGLTKDDSSNLERVQKCAVKIILGNSYSTYLEGLETLMLSTLAKRREKLCLKFAKQCAENPLTKDLFPLCENTHMTTRSGQKYKVVYANTERLKNSPVPYLQRLLNLHYKKS